MSHKILFLDIDGCLNHSAHRDFHGMNTVAPECVRVLFSILEATGAEIVISSTWRTGFVDIDSFKKSFRLVLEQSGVSQAIVESILSSITGMTLDFDDLNRGAEIKEWLDNCGLEVSAHAILDDDADIIGPNENLFLCSDDGSGLTWGIGDRVIRHLK